MTGILLLAHGSREGDTEETMTQMTRFVKAQFKNELIDEAYLQFRGKNLEKGLLSLMGRGADDIKVIPYFLFEGVHIKEDIPAEIDTFRKAHPDVVGSHWGGRWGRTGGWLRLWRTGSESCPSR